MQPDLIGPTLASPAPPFHADRLAIHVRDARLSRATHERSLHAMDLRGAIAVVSGAAAGRFHGSLPARRLRPGRGSRGAYLPSRERTGAAGWPGVRVHP